MLLPKGDLIAMALITLLLVSERLEQPKAPAWGVRGLGKAIRILAVQARIRLQAKVLRPSVLSGESKV
jgi:hypothetical protein